MSKFTDFLNKAQDKTNAVLADPRVEQVSKIGTKIIEVAAQIGMARMNTPLTVLSAGVGLVNILANKDAIELGEQLRIRGYVTYTVPFIVKMLVKRGVFTTGEAILITNSEKVVKINTPEGDLAVVLNKANGEIAHYQGIWMHPGAKIPVKFLSELLWKTIGQYIMLGLDTGRNGYASIGMNDIVPPNDKIYVSSHDPHKMVSNFKKNKSLNIGRSFVLIGPPGTGKTTFSFQVAEILGGRMVLIDPSFFNASVDSAELIELLTACDPSVLLFDDIDSVMGIKSKFLGLFDRLRKSLPNTIVISTCNNFKLLPEALKRPGRLGRRLHFLSPELKMRREIIKQYSELYGIERDLSFLAKHLAHSNFSPDYIKSIIEQALVDSDEELIKYINEVKEDWEEEEEEDYGDDDDEDPPTILDDDDYDEDDIVAAPRG